MKIFMSQSLSMLVFSCVRNMFNGCLAAAQLSFNIIALRLLVRIYIISY